MHDEWGITDGYFDVGGTWHVTSDTTREALRGAMGIPVDGPPMWFVAAGSSPALWNPCRIVLEDGTDSGEVTDIPADLPIGYHRLVPIDGGPTTRLVVHPTSCRALPRAWGAAAQVYALWSRRSWGIGDLGDLRTLTVSLHAAGGRALLLSPFHQPAPSSPQEDSPYFPSSRRAWNPLMIALDDPPPVELQCTPESLIDRDSVWAAKRRVLEAMFADASLRSEAGSVPDPGGVAVWNALCDRYGPDWQEWPGDVRRFDQAAIAERLGNDRDLAAGAAFHEWCQQLIGRQIGDVAATGVDLIGDLAIGISPDGADAWEFQDLLALDMRVGAPPDPFNDQGQEWGIPPFVPWRLRAAAYAPFIETIRCALRGVQGLRIDHVMGLFRQFWIPAGGQPATGAYVTFPADELLAIICLEATRAAAFVVGEDLGTVADGVRQTLAAWNIAGTRVLWFDPLPPGEWPVNSLATITTHDLPTIAGVFEGSDGDAQHAARLRTVSAGGTAADAIADAHSALLHSPASLRLVSLDDITGAIERPNHPGTVDRPNWRRRLPFSVDNIRVAKSAGATE